ncbi:MAG: GNAT family N-acetyltransferase [Phycisphaerae bacterium]|nr:GNAT family N-acetyltransferase [Phycisphaerae bacterium]
MFEEYNIRRFTEGDLGGVYDLIHGTIDICYDGFYSGRAIGYFRGFHSHEGILKRGKNDDVVVMENDGEIIATGALVGNEICGVFIRVDLQGQGLGRLVMGKLEGIACDKGIEEVVLNVSLPSRKFYEKMGYEIYEDCQMDVGAGEILDYWKARKRLLIES